MKVRISRGVAAIRREVRNPASRASTIWLAAQISTSASQIVCHAVFGDRLDADGDIVHVEVDRDGPMALGEAEERVGHEVLSVPGRQIARKRPEEFELFALDAGDMAW